MKINTIFASISTLLLKYVLALAEPLWDCNREWPELELFLPVGLQGARSDEWQSYFLHSLYLFWPLQISRTKLRLLVDAEERGTPKHMEMLPILLDASAKIPGGVFLTFNDPSIYYDVPGINGKGWYRQQMLMLYADNFTLSEFVGFVDTVREC